MLRRLASWRRGLQWQLARALALFREIDGARFRGHSSFAAWYQRRFGLADRDVELMLRLRGEAPSRPALDAAWRQGALDMHDVARVLPWSTAETASDWAAFARHASVKRLVLEVDLHRALRDARGLAWWRQFTSARPLRDVPPSSIRVRWERALGEALPASEPGRAKAACGDRAEGCAMSGASGAGMRVALVADAPPETADLWHEAVRQTSRSTRRRLGAGACVRLMLERFAASHAVDGAGGAIADDETLRARVLRRDGWQCAMPTCRARRHLEAHHVVFRSRGGGDEASNLLTLCRRCHQLVHEGLVRIVAGSRGAPDDLWFVSARGQPVWRYGLRVDGAPALAAAG